jgi:hypothetical protein
MASKAFVDQEHAAMPSSLIQFGRGILASALMAILAFPQSIFAQDSHLVSRADLHNKLLVVARERAQNEQTVRNFLSSEEAKRTLRSAHVDPVEVKTAVANLSDAELAQLSQRAQKAQADFAAGALSKEALLIIVVAIAVVIIIIAVKA